MPFRLIQTSESPPYLRYLVPETGQMVPESHMTAHNVSDLREAIVVHYRANKIPVPGDLDAKLGAWLCDHNPPRFCVDEHGRRPDAGGMLGGFDFATVLQGTRTIADWFLSGKERVTDEEVNRRGSICAYCTENRQPEGCTNCNMPSLMGVINSVVGGKDLPIDNQLRACSVCGCSLRAKLRLPIDVLRRNTSQAQLERFPAHCWMRE